MQEANSSEYFTKYLSPANPIITKQVADEPQIKLNISTSIPLSSQTKAKHNSQGQQEQDSQISQVGDRLTLLNGYSRKTLIYKKSDNSHYNTRNKKTYYSSIFTDLATWPPGPAILVECEGLMFSSQGESMNLFAVHQTGPSQFDLILQNDLNTSGYTQWFYFAVANKFKNTKARFNIVNLYKTRSLYGTGLKPLAQSPNISQEWHRAGTNIEYSKNQINVQNSRRFYSTLSFQHTFLEQNGLTNFAHSFPYTNTDLKRSLKNWQLNPKMKVRLLGPTGLGKKIPILQISQQGSHSNKRSLVFMARQHPGETVGSHIMQEIITQLLKQSTQNQFLLWRFNIYCIPIVNIDGVCLGNYRGNAYGYDLNRCWDKDSNKLPQISCIRREIGKIHRKYPIEMILDLHGHSRKLGSFFYGNSFGKNTGIFAYLASKQSSFINFQDSTFNKQKDDKATTARNVLGTLIKDTGCFYTYETSFYGATQLNGKKIQFKLQNLRQLGRNLVGAAYKTFMEIYKEQKTLRESICLKQARKQVYSHKYNQDGSGSDSEAQRVTLKEMQLKEEKYKTMLINIQAPKLSQQDTQQNQGRARKQCSVEVQVGDSMEVPMHYGNLKDIVMTNSNKLTQCLVEGNMRNYFGKKEQRLVKIGSLSDKCSLQIGFERIEVSPLKYNSSLLEPVDRKLYLMQKLRVFGQTFIQTNPKQAHTHKETQTNPDAPNVIYIGSNPHMNMSPSPPRQAQYRKRRSRNKSLIIKLDNRQQLQMADIVKVKRIDYQRIRRVSGTDLANRSRKQVGAKQLQFPVLN